MGTWIGLVVVIGIVVAAVVVTRRAKDERVALERERSERVGSEVSAAIDVPVEVEIAGTWQRGRLTAFRQDERQWHGYVEFGDSGPAADWFERERVRPLDQQG